MSKDIDKYGWEGVIETSDPAPKVPLKWVATNVKDDGFSFAKSIYINKVFVDLEDGTTVELSQDDFTKFKLSSIKEGANKIQSKFQPLFEYGGNYNADKFNFTEGPGVDYYHFDRHNFKNYPAKGYIYPFKTDKIDSEFPLYIFSSILFGAYGTNPPHEFSGGLNAARFTPSIWFGTMSEKVKAVRFDFRFHLRTDDRGWVLNDSFLGFGYDSKIETSNNFASIIRDSDRLPMASCFNDLIQHFGEFQELSSEFIKTWKESLGELNSIFLQFAWTQSNDLLENFSKMSDLLKKIDAKIDEMLSDIKKIPGCLIDDLGTVIDYSTQVVLDNIALLLADFKKIYNDVLLLIDIQLEIIAEVAKLAFSFTEEVITYLLTPAFGPKKTRKRRKMQEKIARLKREKEKLVDILGDDFDQLSKGLVYVFAKIFNLINFDSGEKPVQNEMVGNYLLEGNVDNTWDNLHWWGTNFLPSAPGAFHAIHQHFRWSKFLGDPSSIESFAISQLFKVLGGGAVAPYDDKSTAPFRSLVAEFKSAKVGGPLIDPGIPNQTIRFAIAKVNSKLDNELSTISSDDSFEDVANTIATPEAIAVPDGKVQYEDNFQGSDIAYWLSLKANRRESDRETFAGTMLINGFYFAHDPEPQASLFGSDPTNFAAITQRTSIFKTNYAKPDKTFREPF